MEMKLELPGDGAQRQLQELDKQLLVLRLSAGKLEAALKRCFEPLAAVVLPGVTAAVRAMTAFFHDTAAVLAELFGFTRREADKTVRHTGKTLKRALAGFDQLERLGGSSGGGSYTVPGEALKLPDRLRPVVEKLQSLLKPHLLSYQQFPKQDDVNLLSLLFQYTYLDVFLPPLDLLIPVY